MHQLKRDVSSRYIKTYITYVKYSNAKYNNNANKLYYNAKYYNVKLITKLDIINANYNNNNKT